MIDQERVGEEGYTPGQVLSILLGEPADIYEAMDITISLEFLPDPERTFLKLLSRGHTATYAMKEAGVVGNSTRFKREAIARLTRVMNGEQRR